MDDTEIAATVDRFSPGLPPIRRTRMILEMRRLSALSDEERQRELRQRISRLLRINSPTPPRH